MKIHQPTIIGNGVWINPKVVFGKNVTIAHGSCVGFPEEGEKRCIIGEKVSIGAFCVISMGSTIEKKVLLEHYCRVDSKAHIGSNTQLLYGARIHYKAKVGKNCIISGNCPDRTIVGNNVRHFGRLVHLQQDTTSDWDATEEPSPIVCDNVLIGANAIIIGGITIGKGSIIAAGEIVKKDIPPNSIFQHGKCKQIKK